ncbi:MAG: hypothetical protein ACTSVI_16220 [Promethearchaeota archaeon]
MADDLLPNSENIRFLEEVVPKLEEWNDKDKIWQVELDVELEKIYPKEITREYFEIQEISTWN